MKKKKLITLIAGLMVAASLSAALVGCDSDAPATTSSSSAAASSAASAAAEDNKTPTPVNGSTFNSEDGSFSFTLPEGYNKIGTSAGATSFLNGDGTALAVVSTAQGTPDSSALTKEAMEATLKTQYSDAVLSNFSTEKEGDGTVISCTLEATVNGNKMTLAQVTYTDANRTINFTMSNADASKVDLDELKGIAATLEIK